ncbi:MAG: hypothetical protein EU539_10640 [Promethearchaeota archaeon]|nr:MAG: hypothetical protein EU539_10640 [Candidatus Lokiarchaeota archaeon]
MADYNYGVIGAGRQGTAAAYDMIKNGNANAVIIADKDINQAKKAVDKVNSLLNVDIAQAEQINVKNDKALVNILANIDSFVSSVPYYFNLDISQAAIKAKASMCDLGGNTDIVKEQLKLNIPAKDAGISIVPDCGQVPGMGTSLCVYAMSLLDEPTHVLMWDGGLPLNPKPPFYYLLTFNIEGLTNEYAEPTFFLREGKLVEIPPFEELEQLELPAPIGKVEAFTTGGGTSTAPWTFEGKLKSYQNKTIRYPSHFSQLRAYWDLGLFDLDPIIVDGKKIIPRNVLHELFEPKVRFDENSPERDVVGIRVKCLGKKNGKKCEVLLDLIDVYDEKTGFTAMQRTTGFDASIVAIMMAQGKIEKGAKPVELAVPAKLFVDELKKRGFDIKISIT